MSDTEPDIGASSAPAPRANPLISSSRNPMTVENTRSVWIFGYGSLIWRPDFPHADKAVGWVADHTRRFWQGSPDHRGTPDSLGRVLTLVPEAHARCWGVAYQLPPGREAEVMAYLDHRERGGYVRVNVDFTIAPLHTLERMKVVGFEQENRAVLEKCSTISAITYIASPSNEHYLGPAPLLSMVEQIAAARGESGRNAEYVLNLAAHLKEMGLEDEHIQTLAEGVREMVEKGMCVSPVIGLKPLAMV